MLEEATSYYLNVFTQSLFFYAGHGLYLKTTFYMTVYGI